MIHKINLMTKYCPKCGSSNIDWVLPQTWSKWRCKDCGYIGVLIIENGELAEEIRKKWKEKASGKGNYEHINSNNG